MKIDISTEQLPESYIVVDDDDYQWVRLWKWTPKENVERTTVYAIRRAKGRTIYLHREIARARFFEQVDHINGNTLDNRKYNLRVCTNAQNQHNRRKRTPGKGNTLFKGVYLVDGRWRSYITVNKKRFHLGVYDHENEAAREYDSKALYYFGPFARLNFTVDQTTPTPIIKNGIEIPRAT